MNNPLGTGVSKEVRHVSDIDLVCYVDGELKPKQAAKIRDHMEACWTCRAKRERIQETISDFVDYLNGPLAREMDAPPRGWQTYQAKMKRVFAQTDKPSSPSQGWGSLRGLLPSSPMFFRLATGVLSTSLVALLAILLNSVPRTSANQLLQKVAEAQEQRLHAVAQPAVYQKLQVHRATAAPAQDGTVTLELWNDASRDRFRERVEDENGQRFNDLEQESVAGRERRSPGRRRPSLEPRKAASAGSRRGVLAAVPPIIRELDEILRTNQMDRRRPLSPLGYESWRRSIQRASEEVKNTNLADGDKALALTTVASGPFGVNSIIKAALVVRTGDWHPVEQQLEVQGKDGVRNYELTETAFEVISANNLNPSIFRDQPWPPPAELGSAAATTASSISPTGAQLLAVDINAEYALHRLRACVGESIDVLRDSAGHVEVRGFAETPERKQQLIAAFRGIPFVKADIQTVAETSMAEPAPPESPSGSEKQKEGSLTHPGTIVQIQSSKLPIEDQLREYFARLRATPSSAQEGDGTSQAGIERQIIDLSNQAVSLSLAASAEAGALRHLAEKYAGAEIKELDPASRWLLEVMVRDHLAALKIQMDQSLALLSPVLSSFRTENLEYLPKKDTHPSDLSVLTPSTWAAWTFRVFTTVQDMEHLTDCLFAGANLPRKKEEVVADLLAVLNRFEDDFLNLRAQVDKDFSGRPNLATIQKRW